MKLNKIGSNQHVLERINEDHFQVKKKFGQNFLLDQNVLTNIVNCANIDKNINVIEIGPGMGALTEHLCFKANKVLAYEIDKDLLPILNENLKDYDNVKIINQDILKANVEEDIKSYFDSKPVYLVANLPYYITTPIILGLLEETTLIRKYVMMMQEEVADRITSKPDVKDYNALSIAIQYRAIAKKELCVSRNVFYPKPNVDSAVISLTLYDTQPAKALNEDAFFKLVRSSFAQRRKTLYNNLVNANYDKEKVKEMFVALNISPSIRSEALSVVDFIKISDYLS